MQDREKYVKPIVMQLHYSTEMEVTVAGNCKQTGSATGSTFSGCTIDVQNPAPCVSTGS